MCSFQESCSCRSQDLSRILTDELELQLALSELLEDIADSLPHKVDANQILISSAILRHRTDLQYALRKEGLFPLLRRRGDAALAEACDRLEREYAEDKDYAHEILEVLEDVSWVTGSANADSVGYMLRGYFASLRRHVAWESEILLPAVKSLLGPNDIQSFHRWLASHAPQRCASCSKRLIQVALDGTSKGMVSRLKDSAQYYG
jgi:hemerythrin-like domain-containing protein